VGSVVGQIARLKGARAVGIAGGAEKCRYVEEELGFDTAIDHRGPDLGTALDKACPRGIDVYFENVGGAVFEAVFPLLNAFARIPVCGLIAHYNDTQAVAPKWAAAMMRNAFIGTRCASLPPSQTAGMLASSMPNVVDSFGQKMPCTIL